MAFFKIMSASLPQSKSRVVANRESDSQIEKDASETSILKSKNNHRL